jgi:hypothetical protein
MPAALRGLIGGWVLLIRRFNGGLHITPPQGWAVAGGSLLAAAFLLTACRGPAPDPREEPGEENTFGLDFAYEEDDLIPGETLLTQLGRISQLDRLEDTEADYARCSTAASLYAYLLLGGDFASAAEKLGVDTAFTFANVHRVQEALHHLAETDGEPGIFGTAKPQYDAEGHLLGWEIPPEDEYHLVVEALGLKLTRVYSQKESEPTDKREGVLQLLDEPEGVVFVVGVMEDMEDERFFPMSEGMGNHYIAIIQQENAFYALDSYRTPGRFLLVALSSDDVEEHLFNTHNAIYALQRAKPPQP